MKFGNWLTAAPATLGGLTQRGWGVLIVGIMCMVLSVVAQKWALGLSLLGGALLFDLVFVIRFGATPGRTIAAVIGDKIGHGRRTASREALYRSGLFSNLPPEAASALPGPLANLEELDGVDGAGQPYTLLYHPSVRSLAVTFACTPDGTDLQPQEHIDAQVSHFGGWHSMLSRDSAIEGAVIVVDSALASSEPLIERIDRSIAAHAPTIAQDATREAARRLPPRDASVDVYTTAVWSVPKLGGDLDDAAAEVAAKLPAHRQQLMSSGAGQVYAATSEELARVVRVAYNPDRSREFGTDDIDGRPLRTRLTSAGPEVLSDAQTRVCFHDGVASMTAMMTVPPRMHITESFMQDLFAPQQKFLRKRVAVFYRPMNGGEGVGRATSLRRSLGVQATAGAPNQFTQHAQILSGKLESELVQGAMMTRFAIEVTVTFHPTAKGYREATQKLKEILEGANLEYRFVDVDTSAAFHCTLPLGVLPWQYATTIQSFTEGDA